VEGPWLAGPQAIEIMRHHLNVTCIMSVNVAQATIALGDAIKAGEVQARETTSPPCAGTRTYVRSLVISGVMPC